MLELQFIYRLALIVLFGTFYVKSMQRMALYNNAETQKEKHTVLKFIGANFLFVGIAAIPVSLYMLSQVQYPDELIRFSVNAYVRPSSSHIEWGYPTDFQLRVINTFNNIYIGLGLATYCFFFKSSHSTIGKKILKFLFNILLFGLFCSVSDFHYFDVYEWLIPDLFVLCVWFVDKRYKSFLDTQFGTKVSEKVEPTPSAILSADSETPLQQNSDETNAQNNINESTEKSEDVHTEFIDTEERQNQVTADGRFCRHCGKQIELNDAKFCKHCGAPLE